MDITIECPWCDRDVALRDDADLIACDVCGVAIEFAGETYPILAVAA